jgi:hypothetical protein
MKDFDKNKGMTDPLKLLRYCLGAETEFRKELSVITGPHGEFILRNKKEDDPYIGKRYIRWANDYSTKFRFKLNKGRITYTEKKKASTESYIRETASDTIANF